MFYQIEDFAGVDTGGLRPSVMAPVGGFNLFVHDAGRGKLPASEKGIVMTDITDALQKGVGAAMDALRRLVGVLDIWEASDLLSVANAMHLGGAKRLIAVTAKKNANLYAKLDGKDLDVLARTARTVKLAMLYYQYTGDEFADKWRAMGGGLDSKTHSKAAVVGLNKYFTPQANVVFELKSAADWALDGWIDSTRGPPAEIPNVDLKGIRTLAKTLTEQKRIDGSADVTAVIVPMLTDSGAAHPLSDEFPNVVFVPWVFKNWKKTDPNADLFLPELCHELVHALGKGEHASRGKVMCNDHSQSTLDQELLIDEDTLKAVNPA